MINNVSTHHKRGKLLFLKTTSIMLLAVFQAYTTEAQTCSCAGAPLISSQSLTTVSKGNLVTGLTWEYNNISNLYAGTRELTNRTQERISSTALLELNYGITNRLSVTSTFTFIEKRRTTGLQNPSNSETLTTRGFGDGLVMLKYHILNQDLWNPYQISIGGGTKIPFATTSLKVDGLALNADMQPGTGAWDGVGWLFASRAIRSWNMNVYVNSTYRITGENERFNESDRYRFGNEFVSLAGISGGLFDRFSFNLMMKYRTTISDQRNGNNMPSTGGEWLNIKPGIGYQISERFNIQLSGELPIYQNLEGTQPTTSYIISGSLFFSLNKNQTGFSYGIPSAN